MRLYREFAAGRVNKKGEYRPRRTGTFLPDATYFEDIMHLNCKGFQSVYAFREEDAKDQESLGNSIGLGRFPVYSDTLWIDLDRGELGLLELERYCADNGLGYQIWSSGGKGYHYGIKIHPMFGHHVPYSQLQFVKTLTDFYDQCLYQHGRMFANPGRIHPETGKLKSLLKAVDGKALFVPIVVPPPKNFTVLEGLDDQLVQLNLGLMQSQYAIEQPPPNGGRHTTLWSIALNFFEGGLQRETAIDLLDNINRSWPDQKTFEEVVRAVDQAYGDR